MFSWQQVLIHSIPHLLASLDQSPWIIKQCQQCDRADFLKCSESLKVPSRHVSCINSSFVTICMSSGSSCLNLGICFRTLAIALSTTFAPCPNLVPVSLFQSLHERLELLWLDSVACSDAIFIYIFWYGEH